jgi:hypothetical protein
MPLSKKYPNFDLDIYLREQSVYFRKHDSDDHIEYAMNCPKCKDRGEARDDTKKRLWVNPEKATFYCYNCGWDGPLTRLVQVFSNCHWRTAIKILQGKRLSNLETFNFQLVHEQYDMDDDEDDLPKEVSFPHGFQSFADASFSCETEPFFNYLEGRGIPLETAIEHGWGFSLAGFTNNRIIAPTYMEDRLVFWQARDILEKRHPSWMTREYRKVLNPKGTSARGVLYNYDTASKHGEIILCEGFIDAVKAGANAVATNGKTLHAAQLDWLSRTNATSIVILWDNDAYTDEKYHRKGKLKGKLKKPSSVDSATSMLKTHFEQVRCVRLPEGRDAGSYEMGELEPIIMGRFEDRS